jgi:hypothetical protein
MRNGTNGSPQPRGYRDGGASVTARAIVDKRKSTYPNYVKIRNRLTPYAAET